MKRLSVMIVSVSALTLLLTGCGNNPGKAVGAVGHTGATIPLEEDVHNLTAAELETTTAEVREYILYTNSTQIKVYIQKDAGFEGEITLWNVTEKDKPFEIMYSRHVDPSNNTCTFTSLSASQRYMVSCEGTGEATVTICD